MQIPCKEFAQTFKFALKSEVKKLIIQGKSPNLTTILLGNAFEQLSYVKIKRSIAEELNIGFDFVHFPQPPQFADFLQFIKEKSNDPQVTGMIIQQPFPAEYDLQKIYETITPVKEIEGHRHDSEFFFPLSLAIMSGLKYVFLVQNKQSSTFDLAECLVDMKKDKQFFKDNLRGKNIVVAGRGATGGRPISDLLLEIGLPPQITHTQIAHPENLYQHADIIITATGRKILSPEFLKPGVILLNVGLRLENGFLKGDYIEKEVESIASFYSKTPGGLGPIDVLYLYKNLINATQLQIK